MLFERVYDIGESNNGQGSINITCEDCYGRLKIGMVLELKVNRVRPLYLTLLDCPAIICDCNWGALPLKKCTLPLPRGGSLCHISSTHSSSSMAMPA